MNDEPRIKLTQEKCDAIMDFLKATFGRCGIVLLAQEAETGFVHSVTNLAQHIDRRHILEVFLAEDYATSELERAV